MKKVFVLLLAVLFLGSCSPKLTKFSYIDNPESYRIVKTNGELKVMGDYAYLETDKGIPLMVDLTVFSIESVTGKSKKYEALHDDVMEQIGLMNAIKRTNDLKTVEPYVVKNND